MFPVCDLSNVNRKCQFQSRTKQFHSRSKDDFHDFRGEVGLWAYFGIGGAAIQKRKGMLDVLKW